LHTKYSKPAAIITSRFAIITGQGMPVIIAPPYTHPVIIAPQNTKEELHIQTMKLLGG